MNNLIQFHNTSRAFHGRDAVRNLNLTVPEGSIYAFLGPNGAGKTTTIHMMLGILRPTSGHVTVFGQDSQKLRPSDKCRIGYVSENQRLPMWMKVREFLAYCRPFYPTWDDPFSQALVRQFNLPPERKLKALSRGMLGKLALASVLSYRPSLLVLDEPFSGLDPLVRHEFIQGVLELIGQEKWTVFISSHDMDEVERLCDHVGIIANGQLMANEAISDLQNRFREVTFHSDPINPPPPQLPPHWMNLQTSSRLVRFVHAHFDETSLPTEILQIAPTAQA
ncbi:MAG: ABC transporter ATP-binding protein, partial [Verrucomicrobiia bacterium]